MVATAVLSFGIVSIYQALFITLDTFNYAGGYLDVIDQVQEKLWQAEDQLAGLGPEAQLETVGQFSAGTRVFDWELSYVSVDEEEELYKIDLTVSWKSGKRRAQVNRSSYVIYERDQTQAS